MISFRKIVIAAIMAVAGVVAFLHFFQSDAALIKKRFAYLAENLEKEGVENELISAAKARRIANMFAEVCRVDFPAYGVSGNISRDKVQPHVMMARSRYQAIAVDFYDFEIIFPVEDAAEVNVSASLKATDVAGETAREIHVLMFVLRKGVRDDALDDDRKGGGNVWLITEIEAVQVLER